MKVKDPEKLRRAFEQAKSAMFAAEQAVSDDSDDPERKNLYRLRTEFGWACHYILKDMEDSQ